MDLWLALRDAARSIADSGNARAVIVTGAGGHFCSGMDLSPTNPAIERILPSISEGIEGPALSLIQELKECVQALADLPCPTIAAIEGACIGGGMEVALACDFRIAAMDASLGLTEVRVGMIPDLGGCVRLTRLVGPGRAAELITTGRKVSGEEAFKIGFVERVVAGGKALEAAQQAAAEILLGAPIAVGLALNVVRLAPDLGATEALAIESRSGAMALTSGEPQEGVQAFFEKRKPVWK
jgi:enoyl-CoA hydratase/carnithine racemase